jgi:hypothetical protein
MRPRFSLRWLLLLTAAIAVACYGWITRPTIVANRFTKSLESRNFGAADRLCVDPNRHFVRRALYIFYQVDASTWISGNRGAQSIPLLVETQVLPRSWDDLWRGQRRLEMTIRDEPASGVHASDARLGQWIGKRTETFQLTATSTSILPPLERAPIYAEFSNHPPPK